MWKFPVMLVVQKWLLSLYILLVVLPGKEKVEGLELFCQILQHVFVALSLFATVCCVQESSLDCSKHQPTKPDQNTTLFGLAQELDGLLDLSQSHRNFVQALTEQPKHLKPDLRLVLLTLVCLATYFFLHFNGSFIQLTLRVLGTAYCLKFLGLPALIMAPDYRLLRA